MASTNNILIHAINGIGLGHIRRTLAIAEQLSRDPSIGRIIFLTNSQHTEFIEQKWFAVERIDIGIEDTLCGMKFSDYESGTHARLDAIVRLHDISVVIHDTFFIRPFVCEHRDLVHFLVLRDSDLEYMQGISNSFWYFRAIFFPHPEQEFSDEKRQLVGQFSNIYFSGYVLGGDVFLSDESIGSDSILVSPGLGGDLDQTVDFFSHALEMQKVLPEFPSERWIFVLGKHAGELRKRLDFPSRSQIIDMNTSIQGLLSWVEMLIGRGGYNTLNEVCYIQKKSLLLPASRFAEDQSLRIRYFERHTNFIRTGEWNVEEDIRVVRSLRSLRICSSQFAERDFWWAEYIAHSVIWEIRKKRVLVYKHIFLPPSEQFLRSEFESLQGISPRFLALASGEMRDVPNDLSDRLNIATAFQGLLRPEYPFVQDKALYKRFIAVVRAYLDREWIDTIYTPFLFDAFFLWPLKRFIPGLRIYSAARWYDVYVFLQKLGSMSRNFLADLHGIFPRDFRMQDYLCRIGELDRTRVPVVRSVIRLESYRFRIPSLSPLRILIGGRFVEKKWLLPLLDLLACMRTMGCQIEKVTIVGDGDLRSSILSRIAELWLSSVVSCVGTVDHAELLDLLDMHSCYISYSRPAADGDDEGISNLLVENMLVGNLVFSTISGGDSEVLRERETGFVLSWDPQLDAERVLAVLRILESSPFEYTSILENGRDLARSVFDPAHSIQLLESILTHE